MRANVIFGCAGIALIGFTVFAVLLFHSTHTPYEKEALKETAAKEEVPAREEKETAIPLDDAVLQKEAEAEVERFLKEYGMSIPLETMLMQVRLRKAYEEAYQNTYDLEEVFLVEEAQDQMVGDGGMGEEDDMREQIALYADRYEIDMSRYKGMNLEEQLRAIQIEYGRLDDMTDSAYYIPSKDDVEEEFPTRELEQINDAEDTIDEREEMP